MTAQFVIIEGVPYSHKHPKVLALQRATSAPEATPPEPELPSSQSGLRVAKRLRQSSKPKMNKLETEWFGVLLKDEYRENISIQAVKFSLGNGVTFCPDFICTSIGTGRVIAYETKGFMRDDAAVKIKVAASMYPWITWILVWKDKGQWQTQTILP